MEVNFIHFVEKQLAVSYRKDREFFGTLIMSDGTHVDAKAVFFCRDLKVTGTETRFERFNALALQTYSKIARVGRGEVLVLTADEIFDLIHSTLPREPDFLTLGGANGR